MSTFKRAPRNQKLIIRFTQTEHDTLSEAAYSRDLTLSDLIRDALDEYLERHGVRPKRKRKEAHRTTRTIAPRGRRDKTMPTLETIEQKAKNELKRLASLVGGKNWGVAQGKPRIYMPSRRDKKVYFDFPDYPNGDATAPLGGASAKNCIDECGQGEKQKTMRGLYRPGLAIAAAQAGDDELAQLIMDRDDDITADELGRASHELINGRVDEARRILGFQG